MKVLLCLMATVAACNAGLLNGLGGNSVSQVQVQPQQLQHVEHVEHVQQVQHAAPQQQVQIIKIQTLGNGGGYDGGGYAGGYAGGNGGGYSYSAGQSGGDSHVQPQIIKIIHQQAPSSGRSQSYAPNHSAYQTSLESILPQILKIIYEKQGSSSGGNQQGSAYSGQLIDVYGNSGRAIITKGGNSGDYLRGGRVVEKGRLEIVKVDRQNRGGHGGAIGGNGGGHGSGIGGGHGGGLGSALSNLLGGKW